MPEKGDGLRGMDEHPPSYDESESDRDGETAMGLGFLALLGLGLSHVLRTIFG